MKKQIVILAIVFLLCLGQGQNESSFSLLGVGKNIARRAIEKCDGLLKSQINRVLTKTSQAVLNIKSKINLVMIETNTTRETIEKFLNETIEQLNAATDKGANVTECQIILDERFNVSSNYNNKSTICINKVLEDSQSVMDSPRLKAEEALKVVDENTKTALRCVDDLSGITGAFQAARCALKAKVESDLKVAEILPLFNGDLKKLLKLKNEISPMLRKCLSTSEFDEIKKNLKKYEEEVRNCILEKVLPTSTGTTNQQSIESRNSRRKNNNQF